MQEGVCDILLGIPKCGEGPERTMVEQRAEDVRYECVRAGVSSK
jgi:hypothetical protein